MTEFFNRVKAIRTRIEAIVAQTKTASKVQDGLLAGANLSSNSKREEDEKQLEDIRADVNKNALKIRNELRNMQVELEKEDQNITDINTPAELRIKVNLYKSLMDQFLDAMGKWKNNQEEFKDKSREKVVRQINIVSMNKGEKVSDEVIEEYMSGKKQIFTDVIVTGKVQSAFNDIQQQHDEILKLETSLRELHQLFVDMAVLVKAQGETLDLIENHVQNIDAYIQEGAKELKEANKYQKKARKKQFALLGFATLAAMGVGAGVLL
jgi:syntaxin 1B/2/3